MPRLRPTSVRRHFVVMEVRGTPPSSGEGALLIRDNWDDFGFQTLFDLYVYDEQGVCRNIGPVKIARSGMALPDSRTNLPGEFDELGNVWFSLGQDRSYYENLNNLPEERRKFILKALGDVAFDAGRLKRFKNERAFKESFLRTIPESLISSQFHRLSHGGNALTEYKFQIQIPRMSSDSVGPNLDFSVDPVMYPPTNIHVLVGRNGVGKTHLLTHIVEEFDPRMRGGRQRGNNPWVFDPGMLPSFTGLVSIGFSAFDYRGDLEPEGESAESTRVHVVGLRKGSKLKTGAELSAEFIQSLHSCLHGPKRRRWTQAIALLESDPGFRDHQIGVLASEQGLAVSSETTEQAKALFETLSSGHKAILLSMTKLVEKVEEKTLVLIDEPESHLHPPLLSAFIRAVSWLLMERNAVAIVATHSPVVLQEVPRECVWVLRRTGNTQSAERPLIETFGENVGILTREVFDLEVTSSGFHALLRREALSASTAEEVFSKFNEKLGAEARAIVRTLIAGKHLQ